MEGGIVERPWWLSAAVHFINTIVAWVDLAIVEDRTFCGKSRHWALILGFIYCMWALLVKAVYGKFPYPILNKLPFPWGFIGFVMVGLSVLVLLHEAGRIMKEMLDGKKKTKEKGGEKKTVMKRVAVKGGGIISSSAPAGKSNGTAGTRRSSRIREASHS